MPPGRRGRRLMGEINVVPYIDVMLVLLIIFMVTAPLLTQGIEVELPKVGAQPLDPADYLDEEALVLSVDAAGNLYLNFGERTAPVSVEDATEQARALLSRGPDRPVLVRADARASYGDVALAMRVLQDAGAGQIGMVTDPEELNIPGGR
ncbi:ExbD/TolR family protein [Thioalkalivibrio sp. XN279]|uniref:ExbD/TolR family protein n=1 Tax=Thioalkalivibrio sp. XN279 TaxID=2714953 RepID=UPI00140B0B07|nr:ExbD/TolR family protein [Thioalkalivibrio sp. XN279]NHA14364.1 ExbD/TolR family protein [Thioalkalivibrio sp. XN279]